MVRREGTGALTTREMAAAYCGFTERTFDAWVRAGLLPSPPPNGWMKAQLDEVLGSLVRIRLPPDIRSRPSAHIRLPNVQKLRRRLVDDRYREHLRHRKTGHKLPGPLGSAECMTALIAAERRYAAQQQATSVPKEPPRHGRNQSPSTAQQSHAASSSLPELVTQNPPPLSSDAVLHLGGAPLWEHQLPLYPDEQQLAAAVLGRNRAAEWPALAAHLERQGLPCLDPIFNARFWPSVLKFLLVRAGLDEGILVGVKSPALARVRVVPFAPDGKEVLDGEEASAGLDSGRPNRPGRSRI
jgi:hypothetical protein